MIFHLVSSGIFKDFFPSSLHVGDEENFPIEESRGSTAVCPHEWVGPGAKMPDPVLNHKTSPENVTEKLVASPKILGDPPFTPS